MQEMIFQMKNISKKIEYMQVTFNHYANGGEGLEFSDIVL